MPTVTETPTRIGIHIAEDCDYYLSPIGDAEIVADERAHFADGTWTPYLLTTVVECAHCGHRYTTDSLGGVVAETTSLVDSIVWADDPSLADADADYLRAQIRDLIHAEQTTRTAPDYWVALPTD
jgi:hypothetical protein